MENLLNRLGVSVKHLQCLDDTFREKSTLYREMENKIISNVGVDNLNEIYRELYAGGKLQGKLYRQMILGDIIEYVFSGRAYYYAAKSTENFNIFSKLVLYCVNQLLIFDTITVNPEIRKFYIGKLEKNIDASLLYEREGDKELAEELKSSDILLWQEGWDKYNAFIDSLLPKTLGAPKELIVFLELIRRKKGLVIPLLLIQRLFGDGKAIAPPDFLYLKGNKEIFGIEVGYAKEGQSREFSLRTSIPTFAVDLANHMHNRCHKCGENILYCDKVIEKYADGSLKDVLDEDGEFKCREDCLITDNGVCQYANYYGWYKGHCFYGEQKKGDDKQAMHYHARCVYNGVYKYYGNEKKIWDNHRDKFFAQIPRIEGIDEERL